MIALYHVSPLFVALLAPLFAWLLFLGRRSPRRTARIVSLVAALAVLVVLADAAVEVWGVGVIVRNLSSVYAVDLVGTIASPLAMMLGYAAWTLLLVDAVGDRRRFALLTIVLAVALAMQVGLTVRTSSQAVQLQQALEGLGGVGLLLDTLLQFVVAAVPCVIAFAFPATAATVPPTTGSPASHNSADSAAS